MMFLFRVVILLCAVVAIICAIGIYYENPAHDPNLGYSRGGSIGFSGPGPSN